MFFRAKPGRPRWLAIVTLILGLAISLTTTRVIMRDAEVSAALMSGVEALAYKVAEMKGKVPEASKPEEAKPQAAQPQQTSLFAKAPELELTDRGSEKSQVKVNRGSAPQTWKNIRVAE